MNVSVESLEPVLIAIGALIGLLAIVATIGRMYRKVGPNQALIVYGVGGTRVVTGSGALVMPMVQSARELSLELMSFDVAPKKELYTHQGVAVLIDAVTQLKVKSDLESVRTAAEQFLDKLADARESAIRLVMEGHLRGIVGQLTVEQIVKEPEMVGDKVRSTCAADLSKMGLEMISFTIKEVRDQSEYIKNMGIPEVERVKKEANIAAAEAARDTDIKRAEALREAAVARAGADQARVIAETASLAKQAEAQRDLELRKSEYQESVQRKKAQADKAYEIQTNVMQQQAIAEQVKIQEIERAAQVKVAEQEIARNQNELIATQLNAAQIEAKRILALAQAEKERVALAAEASAEALRKQGAAEAEVIRQKGQAEADAMNKKADAYRGYTQAAVLDKLLTSLPDIVRAMADPLSKVDRITVVSTGDGPSGAGAGVNKITADVAKMIAQVPALVESLSGVSLQALLRELPHVGAAIRSKDNGGGAGEAKGGLGASRRPMADTEGGLGKTEAEGAVASAGAPGRTAEG
jgi:flotillin